MAGPFKMKGPSLYGSPMKQDKSKKVKARATGPRFAGKKYRLGKKTERKTGKVTYEKIDQNGVSTEISESEYNTMLKGK